MNGWLAVVGRCPTFTAGTVVEMFLPVGAAWTAGRAGGGVTGDVTGMGASTGVVGRAYRRVAVGGAHGAA